MSNIKKELIDFETHCFETGQLQVGELMSTAIMHIAELEKRLSNAEAMGDKEQSIRDLEQQAKGCDDGAKACSISLGGDSVVIGETELNDYANDLRNQVKALKEQE
jgi:hypothetical protein